VAVTPGDKDSLVGIPLPAIWIVAASNKDEKIE
jgi:hypothetical protein